MSLHLACSVSSAEDTAVPTPRPPPQSPGHSRCQLPYLCSPGRNEAPGMNAPGNSTQPTTDMQTPALVLLDVSCPGQKGGAPTAHNHHLLVALQTPFSDCLPSGHLAFPQLSVPWCQDFVRSPVLLTFLLL